MIAWPSELPRLAGTRVELRALQHGDAPALLSIFGDEEVMRFWSSPPLRELAEARALVDELRASFERQSLLQWGIEARESGRIIGTCTLHNLRIAHRRGELGFAMAREHWGRGLAAEAVDRVIHFSFSELGFHRLEADTDPHNERALKLLERCGFVREGYLRERWHHMGRIDDGVFLGLLRKDWNARSSHSGC